MNHVVDFLILHYAKGVGMLYKHHSLIKVVTYLVNRE